MHSSPIRSGGGKLSVSKNQSVFATFLAEHKLKDVVAQAVMMMVKIMMIATVDIIKDDGGTF